MTKAKVFSINYHRKSFPSLTSLMLTVTTLQRSKKPLIYSFLPVVEAFSRLQKNTQHCTTRYITIIQIANVPIFPCPLSSVYFTSSSISGKNGIYDCLQINSKQSLQFNLAGFCLFFETCDLTYTRQFSYCLAFKPIQENASTYSAVSKVTE